MEPTQENIRAFDALHRARHEPDILPPIVARTRFTSVRMAFGFAKPTVSASAISSTPIAATFSANCTTRSCGTLPSSVQPNEVASPQNSFGRFAGSMVLRKSAMR